MAQVLVDAPAPALLVAGRWHVLRGTGVPGYLSPGTPALVIALASPGETVDAIDADLLWVLADGERGQHWQAIAITIGLHLLPLLLGWVATPPMLPPPEQDVRISLRLLAPATPPQPVEERQADTPARRSTRVRRNRQSRPRRQNPPLRTRASWRQRNKRDGSKAAAGRPACGRDRCQSRTGIDHGRAARSDAPPAELPGRRRQRPVGSPPDGAAGALPLLPCRRARAGSRALRGSGPASTAKVACWRCGWAVQWPADAG